MILLDVIRSAIVHEHTGGGGSKVMFFIAAGIFTLGAMIKWKVA
jgi:hypothetical protein